MIKNDALVSQKGALTHRRDAKVKFQGDFPLSTVL